MTLPLSDELLHFSAKPLRVVRDARQLAEPQVKPAGLWASVGLAWPEWCEDEQCFIESLMHVTRISLTDGANILRLTDASDLDAFTEQYGRIPSFYFGAPGDPRRFTYIAWATVAADFDGIVIAPYCYERRLDLFWYYGWDVASGCIWNARAVASLESINLADLRDTPVPAPVGREQENSDGTARTNDHS